MQSWTDTTESIDARPAWIQIHAGGVSELEPKPHLHCERCESRIPLPFPMKLAHFADMVREFISEHRALCGRLQ